MCEIGSPVTQQQTAANGAFSLHSSSTTWLDLTRHDMVPGRTFSITKRYLLNVGGVVIARLRKTAVTSFYTRHKQASNKIEPYGCYAVAGFFKNAGFDSCVGRLMTLPATTLLTNQWPAVCARRISVSARLAWNLSRAGTKKVPGTKYYPRWKRKKNPVEASRVVLELCSGKAPL